ncbi:hypothetical protein RRG08_047671 [Elysia crispata]|uniref:Uncharacterized protein n=1 Tax=Elysia crispata TaxID=231223 RepID=A0AAE1BCM8_9GAST|nr:hypothetical protein RRG08_047671 [Elysia crispata]
MGLKDRVGDTGDKDSGGIFVIIILTYTRGGTYTAMGGSCMKWAELTLVEWSLSLLAGYDQLQDNQDIPSRPIQNE